MIFVHFPEIFVPFSEGNLSLVSLFILVFSERYTSLISSMPFLHLAGEVTTLSLTSFSLSLPRLENLPGFITFLLPISLTFLDNIYIYIYSGPQRLVAYI